MKDLGVVFDNELQIEGEKKVEKANSKK